MLQEISIIRRLFRDPRRTLLVGGIVLLLVAGLSIVLCVRGCGSQCSNDSGAVAAASRPTTQAADASGPAIVADSAPRPVLSLSVNGAMECQTYRGWPLSAVVVVTHPSRFGTDAPAVRIGADGRPWTQSLRLVVTTADGKAAQLPLKLTRSDPPGALELSGDNTGRAMWQVSSSDSAAIAPGNYTLRAELDAGSAGTLVSRPIALRISAEPAQLSLQEDARKQRMLAVEAMQRQDWASAAKRVDAILAKRPDDIAAWELKGDMLRAQKKLREAMAAYDSAVAAFGRIAKADDDLSRALIAKRRKVMSQLLAEN